MWVFYGHKNRSTQRIKPRNRILWLAIQIIMHRPSKYTDPFFDAGEFRRYMLTFPFDKLPFIDPLVCGVNRRFPALLSASIHVLFYQKKQVHTDLYMKFNFQVFHTWSLRTSILTQKRVKLRTFVKFKRNGVCLDTLLFEGTPGISEKETTKNFDFLVSWHRSTSHRISKNDNNPLSSVFV